MDTISLKRYILDNDKCELILESIGCHKIKYNASKEYYSAAQSDGDNPCGVVIYLTPYLNYVSFSRGIAYEESKDIIDLVQSATEKKFVEAVKYLHEILDLEYTPYKKKKQEKEEKKFDPLDVFKRNVGRRGKVDVAEIQYLDEKLIDEYMPLLHVSWFKEGIMEWTRKKFGLAYSYKHKRIVIPHYHWLTNSLIGFNKRSTIKNCSELGIPKYTLTSGMNKSLNIYGYTQNKEDIERSGYCILYESEKSVLKRDSRNDPTGLALSGKVISDEQVRIVLSLDITEVVVALDRDVCVEEVWSICERFYHLRKVSYIYDEWDITGEHDSPADANNKTFSFLMKYRNVYDDECHRKYLESLNR